MKNKSLLLVVLLLCGILIFSGCADSGKSDGGDATQKTTVAEKTTESISEEKTISFSLDSTVECDGLCKMSDLYCEVLDDDAVADGWYYYYTDTDQSPAKIINWEPSSDNYTTAEVIFTVKNTSGKSQTFSDKVTAKMLYREDKDSKTQTFNGTVFQQNPGQVEERGEIIMWSTKPVEIKADESTNVSFRFDIPKDVYEKMYAAATGEKTEITETCEFDFGNNTTFVIDLAKTLIPASKSEE